MCYHTLGDARSALKRGIIGRETEKGNFSNLDAAWFLFVCVVEQDKPLTDHSEWDSTWLFFIYYSVQCTISAAEKFPSLCSALQYPFDSTPIHHVLCLHNSINSVLLYTRLFYLTLSLFQSTLIISLKTTYYSIPIYSIQSTTLKPSYPVYITPFN